MGDVNAIPGGTRAAAKVARVRRVLQLVTVVLFLLACAVQLWAQFVVDHAWIIGSIALPVLCLLGWYAASVRCWDRLAIATGLGLLFSWLGDGVGSISLQVKLALFLVAQICYLVGFAPLLRDAWRRSRAAGGARHRPWWWLLYPAAALAVIIGVAPASGALAPAVVGYGIVLGGAALAATTLGPLGIVGGGLFMVSDSLLATQEFLGWRLPQQGLVIMATYLAAQALLAGAVVRRQSRNLS